MTFKETFSNYNLTNCQTLLVDELEKFFAENTNYFILKEYASYR